jgi:xanthine dehydrogenase accessory factor
MLSIYKYISELEDGSQRAVFCIITQTKGSVPRKAGAKMLVLGNGKIYGSIGGGSLEKKVIEDALEVIKTQKPSTFTHALVQDHGMCCGGTVEIYIEPIVNRKKLYVFGGGHIGKALAQYAHQLGFMVTVIDERLEIIREIENLVPSEGQLPAIKTLNLYHHSSFQELEFDKQAFICVITHNHAYDREIIACCAKKPHAYLGMIGSKRKVEVAKKLFREGNLLTEEEMDKIDWPMGIDIKAQTPEEIAIAILAKLIDVRNS